MIDLNYKKHSEPEQDNSVGLLIMAVMPFAWMFFFLLGRGL